jgi:uncharacterized iron-regulated membrane protein
LEQVTHKKYYQVHSWVGVITAILMFVIAFTGALSVFGRPELKIWANEPLRKEIAVDWAEMERLANDHAAQVGPEYLEEVRLQPAGERGYNSHMFIYEGHFEGPDGHEEHRLKWFAHDPHTMALTSAGEGGFEDLFAARGYDMADFITQFHADLHLGRPLGLLLTGLLGLTLMASIVTGIVIHKKILRELFTFRPFRSLRLMWQDTHKVISVWAILFHFAIAFSGAFLGLAFVTLVPAAAFVVFEGDQEALLETFSSQTVPELSGESAYMRIGTVMEKAIANPDSDEVFNANVLGWGDRNARIYVNGTGERTMGNISLLYTGADAEHVETFSNFGRLDGVSGPILDIMLPLHFGNFGGLFVKVLWAVLGFGTAMVALTGMMLWIERRAYGSEGQLSMAAYKRISKLTIGTCGGIVLACIAMFPAQLLLAESGSATFDQFGVVFFSVWALVTLYALVRGNEYRTTKELFAVAGAVLVGTAFLNWGLTGDHPLNVFSEGHTTTTAVDLVLLLIGAWCLQQAVKLPLERRQKSQPRRQDGDTGGAEASSVPAE